MCELSGTGKRNPFIIGKSKNPHVLKQFNYSGYLEVLRISQHG
jgi:hypothetical protein